MLDQLPCDVVERGAVVLDGVPESRGEGIGKFRVATVDNELEADFRSDWDDVIFGLTVDTKGWAGVALDKAKEFSLCGAGVEVCPLELDLSAVEGGR
jgi:hypothetical protein